MIGSDDAMRCVSVDRPFYRENPFHPKPKPSQAAPRPAVKNSFPKIKHIFSARVARGFFSLLDGFSPYWLSVPVLKLAKSTTNEKPP